MAHNIFKLDKQQGLKQAWHGLTEVLPDLSLSNNWLTRWDILPVVLEKRGVPTKYRILECTDNSEIEIGDPYNPETYSPVTNAAFLKLIADSIAGAGHKIVSIGSVRNRGRVFVSIELMGMENFKSAGRTFSTFLNFGNAHDKSSKLWINTSNTCTVCDNTFSVNLVEIEGDSSIGNNLKMGFRHTKNMNLEFPNIVEVIDKAIGVQGKFQAELDVMSKQAASGDDAEKLFAGFMGRHKTEEEIEKGLSTRAQNKITTLVDLFYNGKGNDGDDVSDIFQAFTDYYTHSNAGNGSKPGKQFYSSEFGTGAQYKREFFNIMTDDEKRNEISELGNALLENTK